MLSSGGIFFNELLTTSGIMVEDEFGYVQVSDTLQVMDFR